MVWTAHVLSLFPEMFPGPLGQSLAGKGLQRGDWAMTVTDIRDFATDRHRTVDDSPFGGGAGMVMRPDVVASAIDAARHKADGITKVIYFSPRGRVMDQALVRELAAEPGVILLCGRFEGVDQRVLERPVRGARRLGDEVRDQGGHTGSGRVER